MASCSTMSCPLCFFAFSLPCISLAWFVSEGFTWHDPNRMKISPQIASRPLTRNEKEVTYLAKHFICSGRITGGQMR